MKGPSFSISDVSSTMLITLYARARESTSNNPIIKDPKAVEMIEIIKKEMTGGSVFHSEYLKAGISKDGIRNMNLLMNGHTLMIMKKN